MPYKVSEASRSHARMHNLFMTSGKSPVFLDFRYDVNIHHHFEVFLDMHFSNLARVLKLPFLLYALTYANVDPWSISQFHVRTKDIIAIILPESSPGAILRP